MYDGMELGEVFINLCALPVTSLGIFIYIPVLAFYAITGRADEGGAFIRKILTPTRW